LCHLQAEARLTQSTAGTIRGIVLRIIHPKNSNPDIPMRTKSSITWLLQRLALFSVFFAVGYAENATGKPLPFANISARAQVLTGENVVIAGFVITSTATTTKQVVIRGLGPSLAVSGSGDSRPTPIVPAVGGGLLADPTLTLSGPNGVIYSNNNWRDDVNQQNAIAATGLQPGNDLESAIIWTLPPGSYTVILAGNNGGTGVGLLEVYDVAGAAKIGNLSSRAQVGTGNNVLIGGVIIRSTTRAVIRGIGPSLGQFGVQGALQNPTLELYNASGTLTAANDNWGTNNPDVVSEINYLGLAPGNANESVILPTLVAGNYTAIVKGVNNTTGVGLVELYALPDASYPRIFQAWSDADPLNENIDITRARHDLLIQVDVAFGYNWVDGNGQTTTDYTSETISQNGPIYYSIPTLRSLNPNIKILVQVAHYGMDGDRLPVDHAWWKRGAGTFPNNRVHSIFGGNDYLLDQDNPGLRTHVARQATVLMATGQFDGIFLDTTPQGTSYLLPLLTAVRNDPMAVGIGENGLIIVNPNSSQLTIAELSKINGVYMECGKIGSGIPGHPDWQTVKAALDWNESKTRAPRVNCLENWFITSRTAPSDLKRMRATTALSLTHSNGLALFGDPDDLPAVDHQHNWYDPFWSNHSLGVPIGNHYNIGIADRRDFKNGSVIWNAVENGNLQVTFNEMRKSLATGVISTTFTLTGIDGDIYLINY
jgi:hypothetical protein